MNVVAKDIWQDDLLGRQQDAEYLYKLILHRSSSRPKDQGAYVINVNSPWGQGKSFFLKRMFEMVQSKNHPAVFIDAWKYDFVDDPYSIVVSSLDTYFKDLIKSSPENKKFLDIVSEKTENFRKNFGKIAYTVGKETLKKASKAVVGEGLEIAADLINGPTSIADGNNDNLNDKVIAITEASLGDFSDQAIDMYAQKRLQDINEVKNSLDKFQASLSSILETIFRDGDKAFPLFVFIDELDRCRPTYAIAMLERIKHLFDVRGVVFVMATDTTQLAHSVGAVYGSGFDSKNYLGRFFHRSYNLPQPEIAAIAHALIRASGVDLNDWRFPSRREVKIEMFAEFFDKTSRLFDMSIRQFNQSFEILLDVTAAWDHEFQIEIIYMYPLICNYVVEKDIDLNNGRIIQDSHGFLLQKEKDNSVSWFIERDIFNIDLKEYYSLYSRYINVPLGQAYHDAADELEDTPSEEIGYICSVLQKEFNARRTTLTERNYSELKNYPALIKHARRWEKLD